MQPIRLGLRPSEIVSRDYARTRAWARRIFDEGVWAGVRWWSYYSPDWASFGIWNLAGLRVKDVQPLTLEDPDVLLASRIIARRIVAVPRP